MLKVYVIRRPDTREYKIGISRNPFYRLSQLQSAHARPLELVVTFDGTRETEAAMHGSFSDSRLMGEWFLETPWMLEWIERVRAGIASGEMSDDPI